MGDLPLPGFKANKKKKKKKKTKCLGREAKEGIDSEIELKPKRLPRRHFSFQFLNVFFLAQTWEI
jgi:hypothetical protein